MARFEPRLLSYPYRVIWGAFETTTLRMQQAGWEISAQAFDFNYSMALAFRHQGLQLRGITQRMEERFDPYRPPPRDLTFVIQHMSSDLRIVVHEPPMANFYPIDAQPQMVENWEPKSIDDFGIFATPLTRTQEIIVDPNDVQALFERIKTIQQPEQAAIRARNRTREYMEAGPRQQFHAQILSIAA